MNLQQIFPPKLYLYLLLYLNYSVLTSIVTHFLESKFYLNTFSNCPLFFFSLSFDPFCFSILKYRYYSPLLFAHGSDIFAKNKEQILTLKKKKDREKECGERGQLKASGIEEDYER